MSTTVNLGHVVGPDATINGVNDLTLQAAANGGINYSQSGNTATVSADMTKVQAKLSGTPDQVLGC